MPRLLALTAALVLAAPAAALAAPPFPSDLDDAHRAGPGADVVKAGRGDDLVAGGPGRDRLHGGRGDDVIVDTDGRDVVRGGPGDDRINVRDWSGGDRVACGAGRDVVVADPGDVIADDCEWVSTEHAAEVVRRDVASLSARQKRALVEALHALKRIPSPYDPRLPWYDQFVAWHDEAFDDNPSAHRSAAFLPWHREFLRMFEAALQTVSGKPIALPYWDWTDPASTAAVFADDFMGPSGDPATGYAVTRGPFRQGAWRLYARDDGDPSPFLPDDPEPLPREGRWIERAIGQTEYGRVPTREDVGAILSVGTFDAEPWNDTTPWEGSFRNVLEGWGSPRPSHNTVHVWVGGEYVVDGEQQMGTMGLGTSPNDPVFWLHHANIDRLWSTWSAVNGPVYLPERGAPTGVNRGDPMAPYREIGVTVTPGDLLATRPLGYRYDTDAALESRARAAVQATDLYELAVRGGLLCVL